MDSDGSPDQDGELAPLACSSCKKQKRKCDKQLPSCGLCTRIGRACQYISPEAARESHRANSDEFEMLRQRVNDLESQLASSRASSNGSRCSHSESYRVTGHTANVASPMSIASLVQPPNGFSDFPSVFFMDSWAFAYAGHQLPTSHIRSPPGALEALGSSYDLRALIEEYFNTVHHYFPIISKIRLYQHMSNPLHEPGAEFLLLFMTMKLLVREASAQGLPEQAQLYRDVKILYTHIEAQNCLNIQSMQALLLIALFELGNSIWPAAYLTTGACVRLGHALGVHSKNAVPMLPKPVTWSEQEERRRVAWAMFILDRYANVGQHHRPPACPDPGLDTILPTDDRDWDRGQMSATAPLSLSVIHKTTSISPFARLCQAAHLLSKVMQHTNDTSMTADYLSNEAVQLDVTIRALLEAFRDELATMSEDDSVNFYPAVGLCLSAAMTLYDKYSCSTSLMNAGVTELQVRVHKMSIDGLANVVDRISDLAQRITTQATGSGLDKLSPFCIDCLYSAASTYAWYVRESSDPACSERLQEIKSVLRIVDGKWKAAGEAIRIVESTEFHLDNL